jgi:hypothetical protein
MKTIEQNDPHKIIWPVIPKITKNTLRAIF